MSTPAVPFATGSANGTAGLLTTSPSTRRRGPTIAVLLLAVGCLIPVVPLYQHGISAHAFPSYVEGAPVYQVDRYSAPWIAGAVALAGLAIILLIVAVGRLRPVPAYRDSSTDRGFSDELTVPAHRPLDALPTEAAREY